jgi:hypothetical protein
MVLVNTDRLSIGATRNVHDVGYNQGGTAYCLKKDRHHWKYGDEHWDDRSKHGYITFYDRHLGMAVEHKVEVYPGEGYVDFWTRMKKAEDKGHIEVIGTRCYSAKDEAILTKEIGEAPDKLTIDEGAMVGMSITEGDAWRNGVNSKGKRLEAGGVSMVVIAVIVAIGYLLFVRRGK